MVIRKLIKLIALFTLILSAQIVQAGVIIDDFTDFQAVSNGENGPVSITGTNLGNLTRIITATPSQGGTSTEVVVEAGAFSINNSNDSNGVSSIFYSFNAIDLAAVADAFLFNIIAIDSNDLSQQVQFIAMNGASSAEFGFVNVGGPGQLEIEFSQFTNPAVFSHLTGLRLTFKGVQALDSAFGSLATESKSVPEPSVIVLLVVGLMAMSQKNPLRKQA
jgi:hypothetical protein